MKWFANIDSQIYGPYADDLMQTYVSERRITAHTLISNNPPEGFYPASTYDIFGFWAGTGQASVMQAGNQAVGAGHAQPLQLSQPAVDISTVTPAASPFRRTARTAPQSVSVQTPVNSDAAPALSVFIIMAEIRSENVMAFLTALQDFGPTERVGDALWLVKTDASADMLRNGLSQTLSRQDRMFIVDCFNNKTAWFNIGADLDSRIRKIWETIPGQ